MNSSAAARRPWTADELKKLENLTEAGQTAVEIATILHRTPTSIYAKLQSLDIKRENAARLVEHTLKAHIPNQRERQLMQQLRVAGWVKVTSLPQSPRVIAILLAKGWIDTNEDGTAYRLTDKGLAAKTAPMRISS
jgi:hypothetical protein